MNEKVLSLQVVSIGPAKLCTHSGHTEQWTGGGRRQEVGVFHHTKLERNVNGGPGYGPEGRAGAGRGQVGDSIAGRAIVLTSFLVTCCYISISLVLMC